MENKTYYINELTDFVSLLRGTTLPEKELYQVVPMYFVKSNSLKDSYVIFDSKATKYKKVPELAPYRFLFSMKHMEVLNNTYVPIIDKYTKQLLFTPEEFLSLRKKASGLKEYDGGDFIFSDNLYFPELDKYLDEIPANFATINDEKEKITKEISFILGIDSQAIELIDTGSTARGTNVPSFDGTSSKSDFDFIMKVPKEKLDEIREKLLTKLQVTNRETDYLKIDQYRIRLTNVIIPNLKTPVDIDISFVAEKKDYISTEAALLSRLNQIKSQDEEKYKLIIANIMFAKDMLKKKNAYKPAKSLKAPDKINGALGGVGIENWILQNGGSIIDAAKDFLAHAEDKSFFEFEQIYGVMDFGKNHITVARGGFPYDNFLMKNMRKNGYQNMKQALLEFTNSLNLDSKRTLK